MATTSKRTGGARTAKPAAAVEVAAVDVDALDFDGWNEEEALADSAAAIGLRTIYGNGMFHGRFADGRIVSLPLNVPRSLVDGLPESDGDVYVQVRDLLGALGLHDGAAVLEEQGVIASMAFAVAYLGAIEKVTHATLGKFASSLT